jgi:hypothetical protein
MKPPIFFGLKKLLILTGMVTATIFPASAAISETKTAESGNVKAELSYQRESTDFPKFSKLHLKIVGTGKTLLDQALPETEGAWPLVALDTDAATQYGKDTFQVRNLDTDSEAEILIDLTTGGAHCCSYSLIYHFDPVKQQYSYLNHHWGNGGYKLKTLDSNNVPKFVSQDDRFTYAFGSYAGSGVPLQIWQYRQGKMQDVTRQYPKLIYDNAYYWWQIYVKERKNDTAEYGRGPLAAYLADKYLLGQGQDGWQRVQQVYRGRDRAEFFKKLGDFLQANGYISR